MTNPYDEVIAQDLGRAEKSDNPYDALINQDIGNLQTMARQRAMRAAMTDASKAKRNQELSERIGTPADLVDAAPELIEQSLKADDISEQLSKFPPEQQQWFLQNQNLEALQDDLPRLNALRDAIENKAWYEQSWYERNIKAPVAKGLFRLRSSFNATEIQTNVEAVTVGESVKKFMTENGLDMAVQPDVSEIGQRYQAWLDAGGSEFSDREKRIAQSYLEMPSQIQGRIDEGKNALPVNIRDLSESETAQSYIPMDPNTPETEGFFETIGYMLAENPGMIPRETITSFVQSAPALAAGYLTGGGSLVATAGAAGAGSFAVEQPMKLIEVLREAGYDLNDPEQALAAFNDRELMAEAREKANKKAAGVAGTDALLAFVGGSMLMPGRVGARTLTQAERNLGNQLIQAPIQAAGEGIGEAVGQYWSEGEIDMAEVALETVIGGATSPVEVLTYGAGHYRRGKQAREYLTRINEIANEARQGNAGEKQIHDFVKMAKEQGPLSEVYIDAQELKDILDQTGLDPDSIVERMPAVAEQYYEAMAIGGDVAISLEEFTSVLGNTAAVEHLIDAVRVDPNGMSARQADEWLKGDGQAMLEQVLLSNVEDPATPASKIMDDLTGQLVGAGYSQGVAETEAERMATTFVRIAAMAGKDPMEVYEKYGPKIRRDTGEAGRKVRQTTELDNMLDRLRGGEIPTAKDVYGQSLIEFLRDQGGVVDEGGELSAIDADVGREAFQRNLIQMTGMTLDEASEKLVEAGFMQERDPNQLLEMIANEVRGTPVYAPGNLNAENEALAADLEVLDTELRNMGLDIATLSNDEIIQALSELVTPATAPLEQNRLQRAEAMGFDTSTVLYKGAPAGLESFRPNEATGLIHASTSKNIAQSFAGEGGVYEVFARPGQSWDFDNADHVSMLVDAVDRETVLEQLADPEIAGLQSAIEANGADQIYADFITGIEEGVYTSLELPHVVDILKDKGFDSIRMREDLQADGYNLAVFDPAQLRSVDADFGVGTDGSANILAQPGTPAFDAWFGDSKVVDENGEPLVVYHGTIRGDFSEFKSGDGGTFGAGIYFAQNPGDASFWAGDRESEGFDNEFGGSVIPAYVSIQNPADEETASDAEASYGSRAQEYLKSLGYDGVITPEEIVAFDPTQIKSVNNRGTFDPNDPNILNQGGGYQVSEAESPFASTFNGGVRFKTDNGVLDVVQPTSAPFQNSIVNFVVDESARGQGQGGALLDAAIEKYGDSLGGAFSSEASLVAAYNRGFRGIGDNAGLSLGELEDLRRDMSSVTMEYDQSAMNQDIADSYVPFSDFYFEESVAEIMEEGADRDLAERLAAKPRFAVPMDAVTGLIEGRRESADGVMDAERAVERAVQFVADTGGNAFYVSADVANLGGLNAHMNNVQARANVHYRALADILSEELAGTGGYVDGFRTGGDEFGAIVVGGDSQRVATAIAAAQVRVEAYKKAHGLDEFMHPKYPTDDSRRGLGLHLGYTQVVPGLSGKEVMELADTDMDASKKGEQSNVRRNQEEARREAVRDGRSQGAAAQARGASGPAQAGAGRSRARQLIADLIQRRNKLDQFVGESSLTADRDSLDAAKKMAADGKSQTQILNSTGWHKGVDGKWRYEISDDQAAFVTVQYPEPEEYMADKDIAYQQMESGIVKATYGDPSRSDYMAAYGHTETEAMENLAFHLMRDEFGKTFDPSSPAESNQSLGSIIEHPKLFAAYPWLSAVSVRFRDLPDGVRGQLTTYGDIPVISVRADMDAEQKMSTLMHEVQHAIQAHEGFASGGSVDAEFSSTIKQALSQLEGKSDLAVKEWQWANDDKIKSADEAAERAKHALMFDSAQRLIEYAHHDRPSSVFRHIRNNLQWIYGVRGDDVANELQRMFYHIPKRHKSKERNKFLADMAMKGAQWLREQIPEQTWKDFKSDDRTVKSMVKAMQREAERKSDALEPMRKLERQAQDARRVHEQSRFKTPVEIYYALAGEIEARNTQARLSMTEQERRDMSPERTADVPADEAIVIMGGLELQAPERMDSFAPEALDQSTVDQTDTPEFRAWAGTDDPVIDPYEINDHDFSGDGPFVMRVFHGTTHEFTEFDASVKGTKEGQFGAVNYFTSSEQDASDNYSGEGPDLTNRIERESEMLEDELADEPMSRLREVAEDNGIDHAQYTEGQYYQLLGVLAQEIARKRLSGGGGDVMELFVRTERPFVVGTADSPFIEFVDFEALQEEAIERVAEEAGIDADEVRENMDEYEDQVDEARWEIEADQENPLLEAIQAVADRYDDMDAQELFAAVSDISLEGTTQSNFEALLRDQEQLSYATDPESGELAGYHALGEIIQELGYDSIILKSADERFENMYMEPGTTHIHIFDADNTNIKSATDNRGTFDRTSANILEQGKRQGVTRGQFFYDAMNQGVIQLADAADLSTLTHESYHMFLDVMAELGAESQEVAGELAKIRKWLSRNPADLRRDAVRYAKQAGEKDVAEMIGAMDDKALKEFYETQQLSLRTLPPAGASRYLSVAGLEYFARAGEAYMLEGRAPSEGLAGVFRRMKQWFIQVYKTAKALKVNLSDDIIDVFDRMIATDEEIAKAQRMAGYGTSLADVEGLQWTDEERETVAKLTGEAREQAERDLMREQLADMQKVNQKWWEDEKDKVRAEVLEELNRDAGYQARQMLTAGRRADGQSLPEGVEQIKLDRQALVDEFGIEYLRRLPSPKNPDNRAPQYVYAREGGQDPAMVARLYGFDSVRDLVEALINTRPVTPYVESLVEAEMRSRHPDINLSGEAAEIAMESVYNDKQAQAMLAELRKLESAAGRPETIPQLFRNKAKEVIAQKLVRDIKPQMYQSKAATFERESLREAIAGNYVEALQAKQKALMHHYIYREAVAARKEADKVYDYAKRLQKKSAQERIGKAGADYLDRINEILGKYEFRRVSIKDLNRRKSLLDWVAEKQEAGEHVDVPEAVIARAEQTNWREVPVEELLAAKDALKNLEHVARLKNRLQSDQAKRELQEVVDAVVKQVEKTKGKKRGKAFFEQKRLSEKAKDAGMDYASIALNMDSIIKSLDGFEDIGPVYEALKRPIDKASREVLPAMQEEYGDKLSKLFNDNYTRQEQRQMSKDGWVELKGRGSLSREQAIAVGLNWGNEYNREAVMAGIASGQDQLSEIEVRRILDSLEKQDWEFIQGVWDMMDHDLWPQVKAAQERRTGIAPEKVEATPVVTKHGVYRGGYYPVKFDRELGWRVTAQEAEEMAREVRMGGLAKAQTKRGHTIARTNTAGNPLKLDLGVLHGHVNQVLADLALGDAVNDVARVANHRDFVAVMERTGNAWAIRMINNWLKDTAAQEVAGSDILSKFARRVRTGFTISKLGWNIGTIALQPTGLFQTLPETGYRHMAKAIVDVSRGAWIGDGSIFNQVRQRSAFMKSRRASFNKDIELTQRAMKGSGWIEAVLEKTPLVKSMAGGMGPAKAADMIKESLMGGIVAVQQVVDTIVWLAAYEKGKGQFEADADAVQYADNIVARTQASGIFSDRTAFERGTLGDNTRQSEFVRMWTTLGSYMFAKANLAYQKTADTKFRDPGEVLRWMHDMFMLYISEAIFIAFLRNLWPDEDDDETAVGYLAKEGVNTLLSGMPIVRDGASALQGFQGGGAIGSFWDQVGKAGTQIGQGEVDAALLKSLNNVGGTIFRYPSGQMNRTLDALWRDMNGEDVEAVDYLLWRQDD